MGALSRAHGKPLEQHAVAVIRKEGPWGYLYCDGCGASSISKGDFAARAGVNLNQLNKFLRGELLRPDIGARIRKHLLRVEVVR